jgi:hypothetical protein
MAGDDLRLDVLTPPEHIVPLKTVARGLGFTLEALPMTFSSSAAAVEARIVEWAETSTLCLELASPQRFRGSFRACGSIASTPRAATRGRPR